MPTDISAAFTRSCIGCGEARLETGVRFRAAPVVASEPEKTPTYSQRNRLILLLVSGDSLPGARARALTFAEMAMNDLIVQRVDMAVVS